MLLGSGPIASSPIADIGLAAIQSILTQTLGSILLSSAGVAQRTGDLSQTLGAVTLSGAGATSIAALLSKALGAVTLPNVGSNINDPSLSTFSNVNGITKTGSQTGPDALTDWVKLTTTTTGQCRLEAGSPFQLNVAQTFFVDVFPGSTQWAHIGHYNGVGDSYISFNMSTLSVTYTGTGAWTNAVIQPMPGGWYKISATFTPTGNGSGIKVLVSDNSTPFNNVSIGSYYYARNIVLKASNAVIGVAAFLSQTVLDRTSSAAGVIAVIASLNQTLGSLALSAQVKALVVATLNQTLGVMTLLGVSKANIAATLTQALGAITLASTGSISVVAALAQTLGSVTLVAPKNILLYSQQFTNAAWAKNLGSVTDNFALAPNGTFTASKLTQTATNVDQTVTQSQTESSLAAQHTAIVYAKSIDYDYVRICIVNSNVTKYITATYQFSTTTFNVGSAGGSWTIASSSVTNVGDGWFKIVIVANTPAADSVCGLWVGPNLNPASTVVGTGKSILVWQAELRPNNSTVGTITTTSVALDGPITTLGVVSSLAQTLGSLTFVSASTAAIVASLNQTLEAWVTGINYISNSDCKTGTPYSFLSGSIADNGIDTSVTSPDGKTGARKFTVTTTGNIRVGNTTSGIPLKPYVGSVYLKTADGATRGGTIDLNDSGGLGISVTPTWTRFSTFTATNNTSRFFDIDNLPAGQYHIWGYQLETGTAPRSLILTGSAGVGSEIGVTVSAVLSKTLGTLTGVATGVLPIAVVLAQTLGAVTLSASATHPVIGVLNKSLGALTTLAATAVRWKKRWVFFVG